MFDLISVEGRAVWGDPGVFERLFRGCLAVAQLYLGTFVGFRALSFTCTLFLLCYVMWCWYICWCGHDATHKELVSNMRAWYKPRVAFGVVHVLPTVGVLCCLDP